MNCRLLLLPSYSRDPLIFAEKALCTRVQFTIESFTFDSVIRRYHMYKDVWISRIGEEPFCCQDRHNHHDPFAVATCRGSNVVGHMPRKISAICYVFLKKPGTVISCTVTGSRRYSRDLPWKYHVSSSVQGIKQLSVKQPCYLNR